MSQKGNRKFHSASMSRRQKSCKKNVTQDFLKSPTFEDAANCEIFRALEQRAHTAINSKKIFTVIGGFEVIKQSLMQRGWIERLLDFPSRKVTVDEKTIAQTSECFDMQRTVLSQLVRSSPIYFIWQPKYFDGIPLNISYPFRNRVNRLRTFDFTLKEGLHNIAENIQWHIIENVSELNYPRSYLLMDLYQRDYFLQEYRRTLITSFLVFLNDFEHLKDLFSDDGQISIELIYNCIQKVEYQIKVKQNVYIDSEKLINSVTFTEMSKQIEQITTFRKRFRITDYGFSIDKLKTNIKIVVAEIHIYWPDSKYDGHKNIWILKPINKSRGYGVVLMKDPDKMFEHVQRHTENKYIVQKYVERPLLIYNTKFDIRQYFLTVITKGCVNIWTYKECYLKFSSQEFCLVNLHESVHLTNNSIQRFYSNCDRRSEELPFHNMWHLKEFRNFLNTFHGGNIWEERIYPRIKKNIFAVIFASLEEDTELENNNFELNGADFLIGSDFDPVLLEINANPDLSSTTPVTRRICPRLMEDLVKVIIDYNNDPTVSTGDFELIYDCQIPINFLPNVSKAQLNIDGRKILPPIKISRPFLQIKKFKDLFIEGEKLLKPIKSRFRSQRIAQDIKNSRKSDEDGKRSPDAIKKIQKKFKPTKPCKGTRKPRNKFQTIIVQPSDEIVTYVKRLPSILQSQSFVNLNDLIRYLKINDN